MKGSAPLEETVARLKSAYPDATTALDWSNPLELLVATILSAQTTDVTVNSVTPDLFARYPNARAYADADTAELEEDIRPTGFFRNKAKSLQGMARALVADHNGEVPRTMQDLVALPGVGRKTANVVLGNAFGIDEGIVVDTHVRRLSNRLGFSSHSDPEKIERDLMQAVPKGDWTVFSHLLILHGRNTCRARKPACENCSVNDLCPSAFQV